MDNTKSQVVEKQIENSIAIKSNDEIVADLMSSESVSRTDPSLQQRLLSRLFPLVVTFITPVIITLWTIFDDEVYNIYATCNLVVKIQLYRNRVHKLKI